MSDLKIYASIIEDEARAQIDRLLEQSAFSECKVRIMPDVHAGAGCVIGFTADLGDKVIPNIVGVDIGCGMLTAKLGKINIDYAKLDAVIRKYVPSGMNVHEGRKAHFPDLMNMYCYRELKDTRRIERSIGTLGGGNHFIEVDQDDEGNKYLVIHSGSRNLGKQVAQYYQNLAYELLQGKDELLAAQKELISRYKAEGRKQEIEGALSKLRKNFVLRDTDVPKDLAYLTGEYRDHYLHDMKICQQYADVNRMAILSSICTHMDLVPISIFTTVHNYIDHESNIVRKGAVSARKGERLLIPMNMRDGSLICIGNGNDDWNQSAPHGAGRLMSRTQARESLSVDEFKECMKGVYTTSATNATIDEAPMAYKPMDAILPLLDPTVQIERVIYPVYNFKAGEDA